jgi:hypothetical protein
MNAAIFLGGAACGILATLAILWILTCPND